MTQVAQRREPIRSRAYLDGSRGQPCTLEFVGVCNHDPETTVACHIHDETFGKAMKADDISTVDGCSSCHMFLDHGWVGKISQAVLRGHIIRALQRTLRNRVEREIVPLKLDMPKAAKPAAKRKPKAERTAIATRPTEWPKRELRSRNNLRKEPTA